jgi:hypothetical protein
MKMKTKMSICMAVYLTGILNAAPQLLEWYKFEQNTLDSVGINDGTAIGTTTYQESFVLTANQRYAINANGSNHVALPLATGYPRAGEGNGMLKFTYSMWVKQGNYTGTVYLMGAYNTGSNTALQINIKDVGSTQLYMRQNGGTTLTCNAPAGSVSEGWHQLVYTYDGTTAHIYVDKELKGTATATLGNFSAWEYPMVLLGRNARGTIEGRFVGQVDDVRIYNDVMTAEEVAALYHENEILYPHEPTPANGATDVGVIHGNNVDVTLQWKAAADPSNPTQTDPVVKKHYVYMDTDNTDADPNLYYIGEVTITEWSSLAASYGPAPLSYDQSVSWRIEEGLDNGLLGVYAPGDPNNRCGPIWSFKTLASVPVIDLQPQNQYFEAGAGKVLLTLTATTGFPPLTYQWYKEGVALSDGAKYQGTQTNTLVILNPNLADEGSYYCKVTADNGGSMDSDLVFVKMRRMVAHYQFEQNVEDSAGTNHGIVMNGGLAYSAGVPNLGGQTWAADPNGFNYVQLTTDAYPNNGFGNAFRQGSISFWAKTESSGFQVLLGSVNTGTTTLFQIELPGTTGRANLYMRDNDGTGIVASSASPITDGQWHYIVATYQTDNGSGSSAKIYVDGVSGVTATGSALDNLADWEFPMVLMGRNNRGTIDARYSGMVDDLQIYNYELTAEQIADTYYNVTGKQSCILEYGSQFDLTGPDGQPDCKVDLYDLAAMTAVWLDSGLYPILP